MLLAAPDQGSVKSVSEEQLAEREEAIHGGNATHIKGQQERGDTVIEEHQMQQVQPQRLQAVLNLPHNLPIYPPFTVVFCDSDFATEAHNLGMTVF